MSKAEQIIRTLRLEPHPEGGHYRETFRDRSGADGRAHSTAIYFLLKGGETSRWHRIDATEIWHFHAGAALELRLRADDGDTVSHVLGNTLAKQQRPQIIVPAGVWQTARSLGAYTLVGCTVAPGFLFERFEMMPDDRSA